MLKLVRNNSRELIASCIICVNINHFPLVRIYSKRRGVFIYFPKIAVIFSRHICKVYCNFRIVIYSGIPFRTKNIANSVIYFCIKSISKILKCRAYLGLGFRRKVVIIFFLYIKIRSLGAVQKKNFFLLVTVDFVVWVNKKIYRSEEHTSELQ